MRVERLWYEVVPYLYAATGVFAALYRPGPLLMKASGLILLCAALTIVGLRWIYRRDARGSSSLELDRKRYVALVTQDLFYDATTDGPLSSRRR